MTTRQDIEEAVRKYSSVPREMLPDHLRNPQDEHEFALAMAVVAADRPGVEPIYDDNDELTGWKGIGLKNQ